MVKACFGTTYRKLRQVRNVSNAELIQILVSYTINFFKEKISKFHIPFLNLHQMPHAHQ